MHIDCIHGLAKEYLVVFFFFFSYISLQILDKLKALAFYREFLRFSVANV